MLWGMGSSNLAFSAVSGRNPDNYYDEIKGGYKKLTIERNRVEA